MANINQLDGENEQLIQASYLYPDITTIISEFIKTIITIDEQHDCSSFSKISLNVDEEGIHLNISIDHEFWTPENLINIFILKEHSLFRYLNSMAESVIINAKFKSNKYTWKFECSKPPEIIENAKIWKNNQYGLLISVVSLFSKLPVRNRYFIKELDKSLVFQETEFKNIFMFYQSVYERSKSKIEFQFKKGTKSIKIITQSLEEDCSGIELLKFSFENLFISKKKLEMMDCVKINVDNKFYKIEGFITSKGYPSQKYQLVYYNQKQLILPKKWVQHYFNDLFSQQFGFSSSSYSTAKTVGNLHRTYPIIVLRIKTKMAGQEEHDLAESDQRYSRFAELREPKDSQEKLRLLIILETIINQFIKKLNMTLGSSETSKSPDYFDFFADRHSDEPLRQKTKIVISSNAKENEHSLLENFKEHKVNDSKTPVASSKYPKSFFNTLEKSSVSKWKSVLSATEKVTHIVKPLPSKVNINVSAMHDCQVIGQVDKKFILGGLGNGTLLIFDQHATDERIKLEKYIKDFLFSLKEGTLVKEPVKIHLGTLSDLEVSLLDKYKKSLLQMGISLEKDVDGDLYLSELPLVLFKKMRNDHKYILDGVWKHIFELEECKKKKINIKNIKEDGWWSEGYNIPSMIMDILKSNSCRHALMFGDSINKHKCQELIQLLKSCHIPFFCAHGRPSVYPFVYKEKIKPPFTSDYYI
ncbi:uncharacterized protein HGUI_03373 [Hanseniaspora guilliermondii]|uniref:MutL C-terminal dimerisation domain-containing protein n=1 Tax=Hanseniaspora guilliermondii TaxID=56406 RepID=A0A1L0CQ91_9ASCO|nr:uncharacterized protein HGUI_03373 [Hanseniaspora guilliermondii]